MPVISLYVQNDPALLQNKLFTIDELYGMKSDFHMFKKLKEVFSQHGYSIGTYDVIPAEEADIVIYYDRLPDKNITKPQFLIISEPHIYSAAPWDESNHGQFDLVFTYNNRLIGKDKTKYRHYYYPMDFDGLPQMPIPSKQEFEKRKLANLVNGSIANYKYHYRTGSLLGERYRLIEWFSKYHAADFDFFGRNIRKRHYAMSFPGLGMLKKMLPEPVIMKTSEIVQRRIRNVYKGEVSPLKKIANLNKYKFSFCFENTNNIDGYITEKLFDCFFSRTIPVYWGAPDIKDVIPEDCFVDFRKFKNYDELHAYMKSYRFEDAIQMFDQQKNFLMSRQASLMSSDNFAQTIFQEINKVLKRTAIISKNPDNIRKG